MLDRLPAELLIELLSYLSLKDIHAVQEANRSLFHGARDDAVYRHAAHLHALISHPNTGLEDAREGHAGQLFRDVGTWREYCARRIELDQRWLGRGPSLARIFSHKGLDVHRIKIDEAAGFVIISSGHVQEVEEGEENMGLAVVDIATGSLLWSLPREYTSDHAHVEYERGFLIFNLLDGSKDIWYRADLAPPSVDPRPDPHPAQLDVHATLTQSGDTRGCFIPLAHVRTPEPSRALRFVYPTLVVSGFMNAYLFDVPSGVLVQTIPDIQTQAVAAPPESEGHTRLGRVYYVELGARYVVLCGEYELRVFERAEGRLVYKIRTTRSTMATTHRVLEEREEGSGVAVGALTSVHILPQERDPTDGATVAYDFVVMFIAAHLSPCGRHLVALAPDGRLVLVEDFERLFLGDATTRPRIEDIATCIAFEPLSSGPSRGVYLTYEHGRVALATATGIFVVTLDTQKSPYRPVESDRFSPLSFPHLHIARVRGLDESRGMDRVSCVQLTSLGVWFTWSLPWRGTTDTEYVMEWAPRRRLAWVDVGAGETEMAGGPFGHMSSQSW